jgi:hypothetical protein
VFIRVGPAMMERRVAVGSDLAGSGSMSDDVDVNMNDGVAVRTGVASASWRGGARSLSIKFHLPTPSRGTVTAAQ